MKFYSKLKCVLPIIFLLLLYVIFFNSLLTGKSILVTPDFGTSDTLYGELSNKLFASKMLKQLQWPSWEPYHNSGFPMVFLPTGIHNPIFLLIYFLFNMPLAHNIALFTIFCIAGISTYFYISALRLPRISALIGAITFSLSGIFVTQMPHITMIEVLCFLPVGLLIIEKSVTENRIWVASLLSFVIGLVNLSGSPQIQLYVMIYIFSYLVFRIAVAGQTKKLKMKFFAVFMAAFVIGITMSAVILLPGWEFTKISNRSGGVTVMDIKMFPYPFIHFINFLWPYLLGDPRTGTYPRFSDKWGIFWENTGFIGVLPLAFGFIAALRQLKKNKTVLFYTIAAFSTLLLMLGFRSPVFFIYLLPPFTFFRVPARWIMFLVFSLCILSAYGSAFVLQHIRYKIRSGKITNILKAILVLLITVNIFAFIFPYHLRGHTSEWMEKEPQTAQFLKRDSGRFRIFTLGNQYVWNQQFINHGWKNAGSQFLAFNESLSADWNSVYGIEHADTYSILISGRDMMFRKIFSKGIIFSGNFYNITSPADKMLNFMNVKYIITPLGITNIEYKNVFNTTTDPAYKIYENSKAQPRLSLYSDYLLATTEAEYERILTSQNFNPGYTVIIEKNPGKKFTRSSGSKAEITDYLPQKIVINAKMEAEGIMLLADSYHPDWKAYIDGSETEIIPANITQRAIIIPEGNHTVTFTFHSPSLKTGFRISTAAALIACIFSVFLFIRTPDKTVHVGELLRKA